MTVQNVFAKDPDAAKDYSLDYSDWLGSGDTISASSWVLDPADGDLTVDSDSETTTVTSVVLSGGVPGKTYRVTNRITTLGGIQDDRSFFVRVGET